MTGVSGAAASRDDGRGVDAPCSPGAVIGVAVGEELASALHALDVRALDDHDLLDVVAGWERLASWVAERQLAALAEFARRPARIESAADDPVAVRAEYAPLGRWAREFADDEVAMRLRISRLAASTRLRLACALEHLPRTRAALGSGRIDVARARVIADEVADLDPVTAREVEDAVVERAADEPAARLRGRVRRAVLAADPLAAAVRGERARGERRICVTPAADGMADLYAQLPAPDALTVKEAVSAAARAMRAARACDDRRTMDQLMADALVAPFARALETGVLDGAVPVRLARRRGSRAAIQVTVAASTLLGHDDAPAELHGYGPITADVARELAPDARWRRVLTDPYDGAVLDVGTTVYEPPAAICRHVEVRDRLCSAPGCGWPAEACDLDHTVPFPDGSTSAANLAPRCRRHHRLKHAATVSVTRAANGGEVWTMPTGHTYRVGPVNVGVPTRQRDPADDVDEVGEADLERWEAAYAWLVASQEDGPDPLRGPPY